MHGNNQGQPTTIVVNIFLYMQSFYLSMTRLSRGFFFFSFFLSTLNQTIKRNKLKANKNYKPNKLVGGESFPLTIGIDERGGGAVKMRSKKDLTTA